jgi:transposase-like protein
MTVSVFNAKALQDESAAYRWVEAQVWPNGPVCPHCGGVDRISKMGGKSTRIGVYKCYQCRKPFTVKVGTIFESSHIPMRVWLQAMVLMCASKKGVSSNQLHRSLGVSLKTAWFLSHRIREAMREDVLPPMGGGGKAVEADETYFGQVKGEPKRRGVGHKHVILSLVERGGSARSFHVEGTRIVDLAPIIRENISRETALMTDEGTWYREVGREFARHETVKHKQDEYVRGDAHTNTAEGFFSIFKRGMRGIYQHCDERHLHRYLAEFDFRYSNRKALGVEDAERTARAVQGAVGKRLTYRTTRGKAAEGATA